MTQSRVKIPSCGHEMGIEGEREGGVELLSFSSSDEEEVEGTEAEEKKSSSEDRKSVV